MHTFLITIAEISGFSFRRNCLSLEFNWWNDWGYKRIKRNTYIEIQRFNFWCEPCTKYVVKLLNMVPRFAQDQISLCSWKICQPILIDQSDLMRHTLTESLFCHAILTFVFWLEIYLMYFVFHVYRRASTFKHFQIPLQNRYSKCRVYI